MKRKKKKKTEIDTNQPKVKEMIRKINEEEKEKRKDRNKKKEEERSQMDKEQERKVSEHNPDASRGPDKLVGNRDGIKKILRKEETPVGRHFELQTSNSQKLSAGEKRKLKNKELEKEGEVGARKKTGIIDLIGKFEVGRDGKGDRSLDRKESKSDRMNLDNWLGLARRRNNQ